MEMKPHYTTAFFFVGFYNFALAIATKENITSDTKITPMELSRLFSTSIINNASSSVDYAPGGCIYVAVQVSEITMQVLTTRNVTYYLNSTGLKDEKSNVLIKFNSSSLGVIQDIELVTTLWEGEAKITVCLHSIGSGKTQFHIATLNQIETALKTEISAINDKSRHFPGGIKINDHRIEIIQAAINISVYDSKALIIVSKMFGWIYFISWSLSFYPQIYENWRRQSVIGLNFDFLALNTVGYICYSTYNLGMFSFKKVQDEYRLEENTIEIPVESNDLAFSLHGIFACLLTVFQCIVLTRGDQRISKICLIILSGIGLYIISILVVRTIGTFSLLDCLTYLSYIKIFVTAVKYIPQAYMNYQRKSTCGWNIILVLLDLMGGVFSSAQMVVDGYNFNDWSSFLGNPTKFGIALVTYVFDFIFILQHYVFYSNTTSKRDINSYQRLNHHEPSQLGLTG